MCSFFVVSFLAAVAACNACLLPLSAPCGYGVSGYPSALGCGFTGCGPEPYPLPPIMLAEVAPTLVKPTVSLPAPCIPPPQTISNFCNCQKTVVKPQVYQKAITVPSVQNVVSTNYRPITETINYASSPCCGGSGLSGFGSGYGAYSGVGYGCGLSAAPLGVGCGFSAAPLGLGCGFSAAPLGLGCGLPVQAGAGCF